MSGRRVVNGRVGPVFAHLGCSRESFVEAGTEEGEGPGETGSSSSVQGKKGVSTQSFHLTSDQLGVRDFIRSRGHESPLKVPNHTLPPSTRPRSDHHGWGPMNVRRLGV